MLRKKTFWIVFIIVFLATAGGAYAYYGVTTSAAQPQEAADAVQTAVARIGDITVSATGAGTIIPSEEITVGFSSGGRLKELLVDVGSKVAAGDVLARVDDTTAQESLTNAQIQLRQAAFSTDPTATAAGVSLSDISVEQARLSLDNAQSALDELLSWQPDADEIALAEANLAAARANYAAAAGQTAVSSNSITLAQISLDQAQRSLDDAEAAYTTAYDPGREWEFGIPQKKTALEAERTAADRNLLKAQENLTIAQTNYNSAVAGVSSSGTASAQTSVLNAEQSLAAAQTGPTADDIAAAELAVHQAELAWQQALINQEADALSLAQAQLNVTSAEQAVADTTLSAPMDGTVTAVSAHVGENVGSAAFITLADLSQPLLEVYLDETDLAMVGLDYEVDVVFDALPDETFTGKVVRIDPELVNESGITAVRALVQLDSFAKPQTLPVGMNATVEVIGGRATGAVLVPVEALREISAGEYAVFVMENGEPKLRMVQVGIMDFSFAEILSGVTAGEEVTTGLVQTQ